MKHKNTQPLYIFIRENPKNSEPQNGPRRGLDFIALTFCERLLYFSAPAGRENSNVHNFLPDLHNKADNNLHLNSEVCSFKPRKSQELSLGHINVTI